MSEEPLHYGDIVCYNAHKHGYHGTPIMYVGPCAHPIPIGGPGLIDIIGVLGSPAWPVEIEHKAAERWQRCPHV